MGRLIDADNIKGCAKYIKTNENFEPYIMIVDLAKLLDEQPTAYSVGKVVAELEELRDRYDDGIKNFAIRGIIEKAIEIVKQGGVSDDVCEWKAGKSNDEWQPNCEPNSTYNVFGVAWFRKCPYCGKKIKVVE